MDSIPGSSLIEPKIKKVVYVGGDRFVRIEQFAIDVSNDTRVQITPAQFVQHLVDNYSEVARENWSKTVISTVQKLRSEAEDQA